MGTTAMARSVTADGRPGWSVIVSLVLNGIASPHTRRSYEQALEEFLIWFRAEPGRVFNKAAVQSYRTELQTNGLAPSTVNVRLAAIRRLASEAADNGLMAPELAAGIAQARRAKRSGTRLGRWLSAEQAKSLLALPNPETEKGIRDRAILALLVGAGLRRSEVAALDREHIQERDGRWLVADLVGKGGRIRTVPIPAWAYAALRRWTESAGISHGPIFRTVTRHRHIGSRRLTSQAVYSILQQYTDGLGVPARPHDLRRTFAKLAYLGQAPSSRSSCRWVTLRPSRPSCMSASART
jgi:integrase/recombinase XerD